MSVKIQFNNIKRHSMARTSTDINAQGESRQPLLSDSFEVKSDTESCHTPSASWSRSIFDSVRNRSGNVSGFFKENEKNSSIRANQSSSSRNVTNNPFASGQFRSYVWDPQLIIAQIICVQAVFYFSLGGIYAIIASLFTRFGDINISVSLLFQHNTLSKFLLGGATSASHKALAISPLAARLVCAAYVLNIIPTAFLALWYVVQRSRQCWDFVVTIYIIHFFVCFFFNDFTLPSSFFWWFIHFVNAVVITFMGEYLCMRTEMQAIPISGANINASSSSHTSKSHTVSNDGNTTVVIPMDSSLQSTEL